jgi:hypothetical protein
MQDDEYTYGGFVYALYSLDVYSALLAGGAVEDLSLSMDVKTVSVSLSCKVLKQCML